MDTQSVVGRLRAVQLPPGDGWGPLPTAESLLLHREGAPVGGARRKQGKRRKRPGPYLAPLAATRPKGASQEKAVVVRPPRLRALDDWGGGGGGGGEWCSGVTTPSLLTVPRS